MELLLSTHKLRSNCAEILAWPRPGKLYNFIKRQFKPGPSLATKSTNQPRPGPSLARSFIAELAPGLTISIQLLLLLLHYYELQLAKL